MLTSLTFQMHGYLMHSQTEFNSMECPMQKDKNKLHCLFCCICKKAHVSKHSFVLSSIFQLLVPYHTAESLEPSLWQVNTMDGMPGKHTHNMGNFEKPVCLTLYFTIWEESCTRWAKHKTFTQAGWNPTVLQVWSSQGCPLHSFSILVMRM